MSRIMWGVETDPVTIVRGELIEIALQDIWKPIAPKPTKPPQTRKGSK